MSTIKEINEMFRQERYDEAFEIAANEWQANPDNVWEQRKMGWALTFMMKHDAQNADTQNFMQHIEQLFELNLLSYANDQAIFETLLWRVIIAPLSDEQCTLIWQKLRDIDYVASNAYSAYLKAMLKHKQWPNLTEFLEWWNFDKLLAEDYASTEFTNEQGEVKRIMPLAEQAYITYAKCLLSENNLPKIREFAPKIEHLAETYPQMTYPGYYCGKLLLAMDADDQKTLQNLIPFVRRKSRDFWAWQLLAEVFDEEPTKQTACLYRAISCCRKEDFLVNVRSQLALLLIKNDDYARAKFQLDSAIKTRTARSWRIPIELSNLCSQDWYQTTTADCSCPIENYMDITNEIVGLRTEPRQSQKQKQTMQGTVTANKAQTAMFLTNDNSYAFIPKSLAQNLKVGDHAKATVIPSLDKKRNKMGLRCLDIETFYNTPNAEKADVEIPRVDSFQQKHYEINEEDFPF